LPRNTLKGPRKRAILSIQIFDNRSIILVVLKAGISSKNNIFIRDIISDTVLGIGILIFERLRLLLLGSSTKDTMDINVEAVIINRVRLAFPVGNRMVGLTINIDGIFLDPPFQVLLQVDHSDALSRDLLDLRVDLVPWPTTLRAEPPEERSEIIPKLSIAMTNFRPHRLFIRAIAFTPFTASSLLRELSPPCFDQYLVKVFHGNRVLASLTS